jgi:hypothetical protein
MTIEGMRMWSGCKGEDEEQRWGKKMVQQNPFGGK